MGFHMKRTCSTNFLLQTGQTCIEIIIIIKDNRVENKKESEMDSMTKGED